MACHATRTFSYMHLIATDSYNINSVEKHSTTQGASMGFQNMQFFGTQTTRLRRAGKHSMIQLDDTAQTRTKYTYSNDHAYSAAELRSAALQLPRLLAARGRRARIAGCGSTTQSPRLRRNHDPRRVPLRPSASVQSEQRCAAVAVAARRLICASRIGHRISFSRADFLSSSTRPEPVRCCAMFDVGSLFSRSPHTSYSKDKIFFYTAQFFRRCRHLSVRNSSDACESPGAATLFGACGKCGSRRKEKKKSAPRKWRAAQSASLQCAVGRAISAAAMSRLVVPIAHGARLPGNAAHSFAR